MAKITIGVMAALVIWAIIYASGSAPVRKAQLITSESPVYLVADPAWLKSPCSSKDEMQCAGEAHAKAILAKGPISVPPPGNLMNELGLK